MYKIPTILRSQEILDKIFRKASKKSENFRIKNKLKRKKSFTSIKINVVADSLDSLLNKYITAFPSFDRIHKFEYELIDLVLGVNKIRKALSTINWARIQVDKLRRQAVKNINQIRDQNEIAKIDSAREHFYGRVTSVIKQIGKDLQLLNISRDRIKKLPTIDPERITIVFAGFPNVGKSLLVKKISTAKPKVAKYPFTTQEIQLGHLSINKQKIQIIDTPGLLDRTFEERNNIERQAIMALRYLADLIVFILDPTEHCGYSISEQIKLLEEIKKLFKDIEIIEIENKMDLIKTNSQRQKISAITGEGIDELENIIEENLTEKIELLNEEENKSFF